MTYPGKQPIEYHLEIYEPGSTRDLIITFQSDQPFLSIHKGELINPWVWADNQYPDKLLLVVNVEHIIWEVKDHIGYKLCVFTELTENSDEARIPK